ncbi:MAG: rod shape-determining protein, partial [Candidatus Nomurabacteria bacterium]|nr:rod shape-determining protein [Candidatus Nomurabacteria bacterium]
AEKIKVDHAVAAPELRRGSDETLTIKIGSGANARIVDFNTAIVDEIVEARLSEIFELVNHELKKIKRLAKLPGGAVLTGGGAKLKGIADYSREVLSMNVHIGKPHSFGGITDQINSTAFSSAAGLMLFDLDSAPAENRRSSGGLFGGLFARFKKNKK